MGFRIVIGHELEAVQFPPAADRPVGDGELCGRQAVRVDQAKHEGPGKMAGDVGLAQMAKVGVGQGVAQNAGAFGLVQNGKQQAIEQYRAFACGQKMAILGHAEGTGGPL